VAEGGDLVAHQGFLGPVLGVAGGFAGAPGRGGPGGPQEEIGHPLAFGLGGDPAGGDGGVLVPLHDRGGQLGPGAGVGGGLDLVQDQGFRSGVIGVGLEEGLRAGQRLGLGEPLGPQALQGQLGPPVQGLGRPVRGQVGAVAPDGPDVLAPVAQVALLAFQDLAGPHEGPCRALDLGGDGRGVAGDGPSADAQDSEAGDEDQE